MGLSVGRGKPNAMSESSNAQVPAELAPGKKRLGVQVCKAYTLPDSTALLVVSAGSVVDFRGDAIVNAANEGCISGGGVDGAITSAGGPALAQARRELPIVEGTRAVRCPTGSAVLTIGGDLHAEYCIHAVGPSYYSEQANGRTMEECDDLVASAYREAMRCGQQKVLKRIGFSLISSGIFRGQQSLRKVLEAGVVGICNGIYPELEEVHMIAFTGAEQRELQEVCADLLTNSSSPSSPMSTSAQSRGVASTTSEENPTSSVERKVPVPMVVDEVLTNEPPSEAAALLSSTSGSTPLLAVSPVARGLASANSNEPTAKKQLVENPPMTEVEETGQTQKEPVPMTVEAEAAAS